MIVNTEWLLDYLSPRLGLNELLAALPRVGLDIEATHRLSSQLANIRVGFVRSKKPLDGAPGRYVLRVETAKGDVRQIICASAHPVEEGWGVPVALAGSELPSGAAIREEQFHGVLSQGMICLDGELGLVTEGTGMQVFRDEGLLGKPLPEAMPIEQALVDVKVYPNRPDCLGLIGIAREIAALMDLRLAIPAVSAKHAPSSAAVPVEIADVDLCWRYTCQVIEGVRVAPSPTWIAGRLLATGSRPINNVVDITNFVLKEWGHPLHAFDLSQVREKIVVRRFREGESLKILDGRTVARSEGLVPLAIADAVQPIALAGIMGGEGTGITDATKDVLLEAAYFEPANIRLSARKLQIQSDAAYRFERGMDPNETLDAARERAAALLFSDAGATAAGSASDAYPTRVERKIFALPSSRASGYLGIQVSHSQVTDSLSKLGYDCSHGLEQIAAPTRRVDANDAVVLIEDVARVIGYDKIVPKPSPETPTRGTLSTLDMARQTARSILVGQGFLELRGVPLEPVEGAELFSQIEGNSVVLVNPLNSDLARSRRSLIPFALNTAELNAKRHASAFRYFEIDKIFARPKDSAEQEHWCLGMLMGGAAADSEWSARRDADYYDLKGTAESTLEALGARDGLTFEAASINGFAPGTAANILFRGEKLGVMGEIGKELLAPRKIQVPLFAAELLIGKLAVAGQALSRYEPLARFPAVYRDLSFLVQLGVPYAQMEQAVRAAAGPMLESVACIDVFSGKGIAKDSRSIAISLAFRAADRTLASEEVNQAVEQVIARLTKDFAAELRGQS